MSLDEVVSPNAETGFRAAFERLKANKPERLPKNTQVTQNNVAREAGRDPSALKRDRYPLLIMEIRSYIDAIAEVSKAKQQRKDNRTRTQVEQLRDQARQIAKLASIVEAQDQHIIELMDEIERLKAGKVAKL